MVDKAEGRYTEVLNAKKKLEDKISETEKIIADFPRYKKLVRKNPNTTRGAYGKRAILRWFW